MSLARMTPAVLVFAAVMPAASAFAVRPLSENAKRPETRPAELMAASDVYDPVPNGFVNRASGVLATLISQNAGPYQGTPEQAARAYLRDRAGDFGLGRLGDDLILDSVQEAPGGIHVRFHQSCGSVRVWRADLVVSLDVSGTHVRAVHSNYDPILAAAGVSTNAAIDAAAAQQSAIFAVGISGDPRWIGEPSTELWIVREADAVGSPAHLAWRVVLPVDEPLGEWEVFVDAVGGGIHRLRDQAVYTDGSGFSFDPDPLTTAQQNYGGVWSDNNDADNAELNGQRFLRTLKDLTFSNNVWNLIGPWVYLHDFEAPTSPPATSVDPNGFTYTRNQQGFEDVVVYFHLDQNQRYMQSLGFNNIQHAPIHADPHGLSGQDNSHYLPGSNRLAWGEGGVDDAEDADVVLHEYGHAIQFSIVPGWGGNQEGAMGEGFGDLWAGSYSGSISSYHYDWVFNWDGHNNFWSGRVLNSTKHYPENLVGQVHSDGEIWSAAWWLIWKECGRTVTDTDVLKHHFYMGTSATMPQAAAFAMQADKDLYGALHSGSMDNYFTARGFFTASQYSVPALTHTPLGDQNTEGPYPVTVTIQSDSAIVAGSVKLKFGTGAVFDQEVGLNPTGNPNQWGGSIPGQGANVDIRYYIQADNRPGWRGATPLGAEFKYNRFHVGALQAVEELGGTRTLDLLPADPNPFFPGTTLRFDLPIAGDVRLGVYDLAGRNVRMLVSEDLVAGRHAYTWDGRDNDGHAVSSGLYFVRLDTQGTTLSQKILMAK